jgi:mannose-1-phosphate guanylyltransferase
MIWPVILSGGSGTRLWPLSRLERPKQLLPLVGAQTMIQATAARTADPARFRPPVVVANEAHREAIAEQLTQAGTPPGALLLEPAGRNTAPAIALAAHRVAAADPVGVMLVMPSDHVIADGEAFLRAVATLLPFVNDGWLATFGIRATAPETGYGYIQFADRLGDGVHAVRRFVEKPDRATAEAYVASGDYAWNGGIFLLRADRYLAALEAHAPTIAEASAAAMRGATVDGTVVRPDAAAFARCPSDSIDYAVMEHDDRIAVAPVDMGWSDIGSWDALWEIAERDGSGNAVQGDAILVDARDCLVRSDGPLVSLVGTEGLTVVAGRDAVMVAARGRGQDVKKIVDRLAADARSEHVAAAALDRAWGREVRLTRTAETEVHLLTIEPGGTVEVEAASLTLLTGDARLDGSPLRVGHAVTRGGTVRGGEATATLLVVALI